MPSSTHTLTTAWQPLVDMTALPILYFHLEIINYDGESAEFTFGDPNIAQPEIFVPPSSSTNKDNRPLRGVFYGRVLSGVSNIQLNIW